MRIGDLIESLTSHIINAIIKHKTITLDFVLKF